MDLELIRKLCEKRPGGMSKLASDINMSATNLHRCLRTNKIEAGMLEQVARALKVNIGVFFDDDVANASFTQIGDGVQAQKIGKVLMGNHTRQRTSSKKSLSPEELAVENELLKALLEEKDKRMAEKDEFISYLKGGSDEADKA